MSAVRVWTLAAIAKFTMLTSVVFENCVFPKGFNESLLIRLLSPSFASLESVAITGNTMVLSSPEVMQVADIQITDKFAMAVSKKCRRLKDLTLNDCPSVTALTVIGFCESLMGHDSLAVNIHLRNCAFNPMEVSMGAPNSEDCFV